MRIVAQSPDALLIEMDNGTARVVSFAGSVWIPAPSVESVLARGGGWQDYTGDEDAQTVLARTDPDRLAIG